jgi:hypothetical protein
VKWLAFSLAIIAMHTLVMNIDRHFEMGKIGYVVTTKRIINFVTSSGVSENNGVN